MKYEIRPWLMISRVAGRSCAGFQQIACHKVFDIKIDVSFTREAQLVGKSTDQRRPAYDTYAWVVTRESVRTAFLHAALNGDWES